MERKHLIIGGLILVFIGGVLYVRAANAKGKTTKSAATSKHPLEGRNISLGVNGGYGGGAVYLIKDGKKLAYGNNQFEAGYGLNWDKYCDENEDCNTNLLLVNQDVIDAIPDGAKKM
jgi:hypothetical protein